MRGGKEERGASETPSLWATLILRDFVDLYSMEPQVRREIKMAMGNTCEVFLPICTHTISSKDFKVSIFDGYAFVRHDGVKDFESRLRKLRLCYTQGVLYNGKNKVHYVSGSEIAKFRKELNQRIYNCAPSVGSLVEGVEGIFSSMVGMVMSVNTEKKTADVLFKTKTREITANNLSFIALKIKDE